MRPITVPAAALERHRRWRYALAAGACTASAALGALLAVVIP